MIHWDWIATFIVVLLIKEVLKAVFSIITPFLISFLPQLHSMNRSIIAQHYPPAITLYDRIMQNEDISDE